MQRRKFLTEEQRIFVKYYIQDTNASGAFRKMKAELNLPLPKRYKQTATEWMKMPEVLKEIEIAMEEATKRSRNANIMTAQEVMEFFSSVARGQVKDQFGLDAPLSERTKAAQEIAKRTVDIENRQKGIADNVTQLTIDWSRKK